MTTADVRFDFSAASDLAAKCRSAKLRVESLHSSRVTWVSQASKDFSGYFSRLFAGNSSAEGVDSENLCACLGDVAAKVDKLVELARSENQARARAREWQARRDKMSGLEQGWNDFWGLDQRPAGTNGPAPSLNTAPLALQTRQTPAEGTGSESGTSSARPDDLRSFASNYGGADDELTTIVAGLRSADDVFQAGCGWGSLSASSVWSGFDSYIAANRADAQWANTVAGAFEAAGGQGVVSTLSDATLSAVLAAAGVSESRQSVTIVPAQMQGIAPSSGFVDDPVNAATGNFIEPETDVAFFGGAVGLGWSRVYNSMSQVVGAFGVGWSSAADSHVEVGEDGEARWWMPDGRLVRFSREGEGWGRSVGDSFWICREDPRVGGFVVSDAEGGRWVYDASGRFMSLSSGPGSGVRAEWADGRLAGLVHERGRRLDVMWDEDSSRIVGIVGNGRRLSYSYDEAGRLVRVDGADGGAREYRWDEDRSLITEVVDADGVVEVVNTYDESGRVSSQRSAEGRLSRYAYAPGGVTEVSDADGKRANTWINDASGRLIGLVDADGARQRMSYDRWGRQVMVCDREGAVTVSEYDSRGRMIASLDPQGVRTDMTWDEADRLTRLSVSSPAPITGDADQDPALSQACTCFTYEGDSRDPSLIVDPMGGRTVLAWEDGLLRRVTDPTGVSLAYEYDEHGDLVGIVNGEGGRACFDYDDAGRPLSFTSPLGLVTRYAYDEAGRIISRTDPDGATWRWEYTAAGRLAAQVDPLGARTCIAYNEAGHEAHSTDPLGRAISSTWDDLGNLAQVKLPDGRTWGFTHDPLSRLREVVSPAGGRWRADYDSTGKPVSVTDPMGALSEFTWNAGAPTDADDVSEAVEVDALGRPTRFVDNGAAQVLVRDLSGRITEVIDPDGSLTRISRDAAGRPTRIEAPSGATEITYDPLGRRASITTPDGTTSFSYDADSRLIARTDARGVTRIQWDACSRPTRISAPGTTPTTCTYDAAGRLTSMRDAAWGKRRFTYDQAGQLTSITNALGGVTTFTYDACSRLESQTNPAGGTTLHEYTPDDHPSAITDPLGRTWRAHYDLAGALVDIESPDGCHHRAPKTDKTAPTAEHTDTSANDGLVYLRDGQGRLTRIEGGPFGTITYEHTPTRTRMHAPGLTQEWAYDRFGRVIAYEVETPSGRSVSALSYDEDGRLAEVSVDGASTAYSYDEVGQLTGIVSPDEHTLYEWDHAGRITKVTRISDAGSTEEALAYDAAGQLRTRTGPEGTTSYTYDPQGRRTRQDGPTGQVCYTWDSSNRLTAISRAGDETRIDYDDEGRPLLVNGHSLTWDPAGRLTRIDDTPITLLPGALALGETLLPQGARLARSSHPNDPWTALTHPIDAHTGIDANAFIHTCGLHLMGARIYDPTTRQFLSTDPLVHAPIAPWTHTPYSYAANNPLAYTDPTGLKPITDADLAAYNQAHAGFGAQPAEWVGNNWEYLAARAAIVAGVTLMCTGIGGPVGLALLGASGALISGGVSIASQKYAKGTVDWKQVGIEAAVGGLSGLAGGGAGAVVARQITRRGATRVAIGAASGMADGTISGATGYLLQPGPHTPAGLAQATLTNGVIGGATGGIMSSQPKWLTWDDMTNFKWGVYKGSYLDTPDLLFRAGPADSPKGSWYSKDAPLYISQVRNDKALVEYWIEGGEYRDIAMGYAWIHGDGQPAYSGTVAPQTDPVTGIRYPGGTDQIYLSEQRMHDGWHEDVWSWKLAP